jgi:hypothetical protein
MNGRITVRAALLAGALLLAAGTAADAQIGGMLKRAGQRAMGGSAAAAAPAARGRGANVVEITPAVLDGVADVARADAELRRFRAGRQAAEDERRSAEQARETCSDRHEAQAEAYGERMVARLQEVQRKGDHKTMQALADSMVAFQTRLMQANGSECGTAPAGPSLHEQEQALQASREAKLTAAGLTQAQFAVVVERLAPLCRMAARPAAGEGAQIPGHGRGIFYVYTPGEVEAITPRCGTLLPLVQP